jgi:hypothetical protein
MPIHDWSRVEANVFDHFHQRWTIAICDALNSGLLPEGYSALVEQHALGLIPDVLALQRRMPPKRSGPPQGGVLAATPPKTRLVMQTKELAARGNRIAIRHRLGEVVCVIEIVSPGNKASQSGLRSFVAKSIDFLRHGVHMLVIDLFPPTPRDPSGIHKAIWEELGEDEPFELPSEKPLTLVAYVAGNLVAGIETTAYIELVAVGDALPDMPAYLDQDSYVPIPLEATYLAAWAKCPGDMRELVETGRLSGEEDHA